MSDPVDDPKKAVRPRRAKRRKKQPERAKSRFELLEALLREPVQIVVNQNPENMPALRAIILRLLEKSTKGHKRANRLLAKFARFAQSHSPTKRIDVKFVSNDPTDTISQPKKEDNDE
jgi:hypothetical protein